MVNSTQKAVSRFCVASENLGPWRLPFDAVLHQTDIYGIQWHKNILRDTWSSHCVQSNWSVFLFSRRGVPIFCRLGCLTKHLSSPHHRVYLRTIPIALERSMPSSKRGYGAYYQNLATLKAQSRKSWYHLAHLHVMWIKNQQLFWPSFRNLHPWKKKRIDCQSGPKTYLVISFRALGLGAIFWGGACTLLR